MNKKLYSINEVSELSGLGIDVIRKFIKLKVIIKAKTNHKDIRINSYGMHRLNIISELLDKEFDDYSNKVYIKFLILRKNIYTFLNYKLYNFYYICS